MTASYPSGLKTFTNKVNFTQDIDASHVNDLQDEVAAIEAYLGINPHIYGMTDYGTFGDRVTAIQDVLGTNPAGSFDTVSERVAATEAAWTSWTPTWTASGSNPALGNGTLVGAYKQIGSLVIARFKLTIGSSTTKGTGNWRLSYPVTPNSAQVGAAVGSILCRDASGSQSHAALAYAYGTSYFLTSLGQTLKITSGSESLSFTADNVKVKSNISFGVTYKQVPVVSVSSDDTGFSAIWDSVTTTQFDGRLFKTDGTNSTSTRTLKWRAIGPVEASADNATPFTWATGDVLAGVLVYEAA